MKEELGNLNIKVAAYFSEIYQQLKTLENNFDKLAINEEFSGSSSVYELMSNSRKP